MQRPKRTVHGYIIWDVTTELAMQGGNESYQLAGLLVPVPTTPTYVVIHYQHVRLMTLWEPGNGECGFIGDGSSIGTAKVDMHEWGSATSRYINCQHIKHLVQGAYPVHIYNISDVVCV